MTEHNPGRIRMRAIPDLHARAFALRVELPPQDPAADPLRVDACIDLFVAAANAGLCCGDRFLPEHSAAAVTGSWAADGTGAEIACRDLDGGAVRLLANLLRKSLGKAGSSVQAVVVSGPDAGLPATSVDALPYPATLSEARFDIDLVLPEKSLVPISTRMAFAGPLADAEFDLIGSRLRFWKELVGSGAYLEPDAEPSDLPDVDEIEIYLLSPSQLEATVYGFAAADAAFDGLVNMLARTDLALASKLVSVAIW